MDGFVCPMKSSRFFSYISLLNTDTCYYRQWTLPRPEWTDLSITYKITFISLYRRTYYSFVFLVQVIDSDELEKMLDLVAQQGSSLMYTKSEVKDKIFRKIDLDNTNSIDFFECIGVGEASSLILRGYRWLAKDAGIYMTSHCSDQQPFVC